MIFLLEDDVLHKLFHPFSTLLQKFNTDLLYLTLFVID